MYTPVIYELNKFQPLDLCLDLCQAGHNLRRQARSRFIVVLLQPWRCTCIKRFKSNSIILVWRAQSSRQGLGAPPTHALCLRTSLPRLILPLICSRRGHTPCSHHVMQFACLNEVLIWLVIDPKWPQRQSIN